MKQCNCEICSHFADRIGYKKFRKWNAKYVSKIKKELKKLKDKGIKDGCLTSENEDEIYFACLMDSLECAMIIYHDEFRSKKNKIK